MYYKRISCVLPSTPVFAFGLRSFMFVPLVYDPIQLPGATVVKLHSKSGDLSYSIDSVQLHIDRIVLHGELVNPPEGASLLKRACFVVLSDSRIVFGHQGVSLENLELALSLQIPAYRFSVCLPNFEHKKLTKGDFSRVLSRFSDMTLPKIPAQLRVFGCFFDRDNIDTLSEGLRGFFQQLAYEGAQKSVDDFPVSDFLEIWEAHRRACQVVHSTHFENEEYRLSFNKVINQMMVRCLFDTTQKSFYTGMQRMFKWQSDAPEMLFLFAHLPTLVTYIFESGTMSDAIPFSPACGSIDSHLVLNDGAVMRDKFISDLRRFGVSEEVLSDRWDRFFSQFVTVATGVNQGYCALFTKLGYSCVSQDFSVRRLSETQPVLQPASGINQAMYQQRVSGYDYQNSRFDIPDWQRLIGVVEIFCLDANMLRILDSRRPSGVSREAVDFFVRKLLCVLTLVREVPPIAPQKNVPVFSEEMPPERQAFIKSFVDAFQQPGWKRESPFFVLASIVCEVKSLLDVYYDAPETLLTSTVIQASLRQEDGFFSLVRSVSASSACMSFLPWSFYEVRGAKL